MRYPHQLVTAAGEQAAIIRVRLKTNIAINKILVFIFPPLG